MSQNIIQLNPDQYPAWERYLINQSDSSVYQMSGWLTAVSSTYRLPVFPLAYMEDDEIKGVYPLVLIYSPFSGKSLISVPFATSGGLYADSPEIANALINHSQQLATKINARTLELRQTQPIELSTKNSLRLDDRYSTYTLPISHDYEKIWAQCNKKVRNQVRNSEKNDLKILHGTQYLESFFQVFAHRMRDLGTPVHSIKWFENLITSFPDNHEVFIILHHQKTIGGLFALHHNGTFYTLSACSLKAYFRYNPNNFMYWHVIKYACENNYHTFDFGRSTEGSGTSHFKKQWGAITSPLYYYYQDFKQSDLVRAEEPGFAANLFIRCWQHLPFAVSKSIGPLLRKRIP